MAEPKTEKQFTEWAIGRLKPYDKNAKIHTKEQVARIAKSIKQHGLVNTPNVEPNGTNITGHGRLLALAQLGRTTVPVWVRHDLSKVEAAALRIADNKVAEGQMDTSMLQEELRWLGSELDDLTDLGFEERELSFLTDDLGKLDEDLLSGDLFSMSESDSYDTSAETLDNADRLTQPIIKVLGFKEITVADGRTLGRLMAMLKDKHGGDAKTAFMTFVTEVVNE